MNTAAEGLPEVLTLFRQGGGYLTARDAARAGVPSIILTRLLRQGVIERPHRGIYRLVDTSGLEAADAEAEDLLEVQLRFPYARPCLVSALHLHGLTTTRPSAMQFAVPAHHRRLVADSPTLKTFYFGPRAYAAGLTTFEVRGWMLRIYTPEKTLTDLMLRASGASSTSKG